MRALPFLLLLCACSGGGGGGAPAPPPPPPAPPSVVERAVSGVSPFAAGCGGTGGTAFVGAEVEPHLAIDPRDANHLIAVWQQDRWSNGSARGLLGASSLDGGATWTIAQAPFSECTGGNAQNGGAYLRATDPWVTLAPDGAAYQSSLSTSGGSFTPGSVNAILVSRSGDGGRTWSAAATLIRDVGETFFSDKEAITADPLDARFVYVVWDRLQADANGPTWFARTIDGGASWEPARLVYDPGPTSQTIGNLVRVLPDGTLVNLFTQLDGTNQPTPNATLRVIRSTDRGATWSQPILVSSHQPRGTRDPSTNNPIRDGSIVAQMAVGPDGTLHVVWQDGRFTGERDGIAYSRSANGGLTWSTPVRVNGEPGVAAFTPQVHVRADGVVGVTYYDFRSDTPAADTLLTDFWLARSADGLTWSDTRVSAAFDFNGAPQTTGGLFLGDYTGLASAGTAFLALYAKTTGNAANRTDIYFARIPAAAAASAASGEAKRLVERGEDFRARVADHLARAAAARRTAPHEP